MNKTYLYLLFGALFYVTTSQLFAQNKKPEIHPSVILKSTTSDSIYTTEPSYSCSAPALAIMNANPSNHEGYACTYQWIITHQENSTAEVETVLDRYLNDEEETEFTFEQSGIFTLVCYATFINGNDTVVCDKQYFIDNNIDRYKWVYTFYESSITMPNAFSPGNGGANDIYKAKSYKSIIEFHAKIFNRWGQKLYEWDNIDGGWDGTYKGRQVRDGVYYCLVYAKGADGQRISIRKDVNILRGYDASYQRTNNN